ncbi:MAG: hypothetical protein VYE22_19790 [Myxococcota bacterium]|nr:hypothetical protein [Myxococcota bacterium]
MKMSRTMMRLTLLAGLAVSGCAGDDVTADESGLDPTLECPEGFIGWNYRTHPPAELIDEQLRNPDRLDVDDGDATFDGPLPIPVAIDIDAVTCDDDEGTETAEASTAAARRACAGSRGTCDFTVACDNPGARTVRWNCGLGDIDPETSAPRRYQIVYDTAAPLDDTDGIDTWQVTCNPPERAVTPSAPRSACVPAHCYGPSRRDEMMNCVADETMQVITGSDGRRPMPGGTLGITGFEIIPSPEVLREDGRSINYSSDGGDHYAPGAEFGLLVRNTTEESIPVDLWIARPEWDQASQTTRYTHVCSIGRRVIAPTDADGERLSARIPLSCGRLGRIDRARLLASLTSGTYYQSGDDQCAINPPAFFYDARTQRYDLAGYYLQRVVSDSRIDLLGGPASHVIVLPEAARVVEPLLSVNTRPNREVVIEVESDISVIGDNPANPYSWATPDGPADPVLRVAGSLRIPTLEGEPYRSPIPLGVAQMPWDGRSFNARSTFSLSREGRRTLMELPDAYEDVDLPVDLVYYVLRDSARTGPIRVPWEYRGLSTSLRIVRDRFVEPVVGQGPLWEGGGEGRGDRATNASADTDQGVAQACTNAGCENDFSADAATGGDFAQSLYAVDASSQHQRGSSDVMAAETGQVVEVAGVMTMDRIEADLARPPAVDASEPVEVSIEPPWDPIIASLNASRRTPPAPLIREWSRGRYAGVEGLGLAVGVKTKLTIGPLPVTVVAVVSAGVGVALKLGAQFAPSEDDDEAFPCIQTVGGAAPDTAYPAGASIAQGCLVPSGEETAAFQAASDACAELGGRLAEPQSAAEAEALAALAGVAAWVGGQSATYHPDAQCASNYDATRCGSELQTSMRWLSNGGELAAGTGAGALTYVDGGLARSFSRGTLMPTGTTPTGLAMVAVEGSAAPALRPTPMTEELPFVCQFDRVRQADFFRMSLGVELAAGAGVGLAVCSPSDEAGVCVTASVTFISAKLTPTLSNTIHHLTFADDSTGIAGAYGVEVPWEVRALEGEIRAEVRIPLLLTTLTFGWPIIKYQGHVIAEGSLYEQSFPYFQRFR